VSDGLDLNAYWEPLQFELPRASWRRWIDTFLDCPDDIVEWERAAPVPDYTYLAEPRSVVVLFHLIEPGA
jgi:isoamylase